MSTDRELLELAAKAMGLALSWHDWGDFGMQPMAAKIGEVCAGPTTWNPLVDDGDALRLAVKLDLSVCLTLAGLNFPWGTAMVGFSPWSNPTPIATCRFDGPEGKMAAIRRAIVLGAAELGKAMP